MIIRSEQIARSRTQPGAARAHRRSPAVLDSLCRIGVSLRRRLRFISLFGILVLSSPLVAADETVSFQALEESLTCQCGCGLTVHSCNHVSCDSALPLRAEIRGKMEEGGTKEQILQSFADKYGEKILSSPTMVGFNVIAWIMPYLVVGIAVVIILLIINRWGRSKAPKVAAVENKARPRTAMEEQMERELDSLDT